MDNLTTRWEGLPGYLDLNYNTNFFILLPEHQLEDISLQALFEADVSARHPLGWGRYVIEEWVPGDKIRLRNNPNYFRASEGLPRFDQLVFRFAREDNEKNLESIRSGEYDFLDLKASLYPEAIETPDVITHEAEQQIDLHYSPAAVWEHLDSNLHKLTLTMVTRWVPTGRISADTTWTPLQRATDGISKNLVVGWIVK